MNNSKYMKKASVILLIIGLMYLPFASSSIVARAVVSDPFNNPSFEQAATNVAKAFDWQDFGNGYSRVAGGRTGQWAMQVQSSDTTSMSGAYQRIDLQQTSSNPVFIGAYVKGENIVKDAGSYFGASVYAEIHLMNGQTAYWNTSANSGTFDWRWIGFNTGSIPTVTGPIDYIFVIPSLIKASGTATFDDLSVQDFVPTQAAVTIMFDDGPVTASTVAKPVLDSYGFKATIPVISSYIGTTGYMTTAQINTVAQSGWEIMCHSVLHEDMTLMSASQVTAEYQGCKTALQAWTPKNFAFPFGAYNGNLVAEGATYFSSLRGFEQGNNSQGTFPYDVKVRGITTQTTLADIQAWLATAKANKQWVVLVFHDITNTGDDIYHTTPRQFRQIMRAVKNSAIPVKTYDQALQQFAVTK